MASLWGIERTRLVWWVSGLALAGALAFVVYSFVGTFVFGVFIYYATRPVYRRVEKRVRPASLAAAVSLLALALPALLLLAYTTAIGLQELNGFVQQVDLGQYESVIGPYLDVSRVVQSPETLLEEGGLSAAQAFFDQALNYLGFLGTAALHLFVMVGIAFYLLRDDDRLATWFHRRFDDADGVVETYARRVDRDFNNIFFGNILNAVITAVIGAISYNALDYLAPAGVSIPYATLLGLLTGVASLVPVVGMKLVYVPVTGYLTYQAGTTSPGLLWFPAVFALVSFVVVDVIPDLVLRPYVSGRGLHLGMVMFAYIFGPLLFGWYGIFLGPMLLVFVVHFVRLVLPELLAGQPIRPTELGDDIWTRGRTVGSQQTPEDAVAAAEGTPETADADDGQPGETPGTADGGSPVENPGDDGD